MKIRVNKEIIKSLNPCADRYKNYLEHYGDFDGQLEDFLDLERISHSDKIWVSVRLMPIFELECFTIDCAVRAEPTAATVADAAYGAAAAYAAHAAYAYAAAAAYDAYVHAAYAHAAYGAAAAEKQNQIESIIYLIQNCKVLNER